MQTVTKLEFKDNAIAKIKVDDLEFSYVDKQGVRRFKDRLWFRVFSIADV